MWHDKQSYLKVSHFPRNIHMSVAPTSARWQKRKQDHKFALKFFCYEKIQSTSQFFHIQCRENFFKEPIHPIGFISDHKIWIRVLPTSKFLCHSIYFLWNHDNRFHSGRENEFIKEFMGRHEFRHCHSSKPIYPPSPGSTNKRVYKRMNRRDSCWLSGRSSILFSCGSL